MKDKILIYDDDEEILILCKAILSRYDFKVETLTACENILEDVQSIQPDLILMDLWIPEIGGEKAIEILRQSESIKQTPILLFSANADIKEICKKVKADGYIEKPFTINVLMEEIRRYTV
jgi:two-component system cell cycle response regulator DivK